MYFFSKTNNIIETIQKFKIKKNENNGNNWKKIKIINITRIYFYYNFNYIKSQILYNLK